MENIFPLAEKAIIEETIGKTRPSALPPKDQCVKESLISVRKSTIINKKPSWFLSSDISEKEKQMLSSMDKRYFTKEAVMTGTYNNKNLNLEGRKAEYLEIRKWILCEYETTGKYIPLSIVMRSKNSLLATVVFNFLEDNKIINYNIDLLETIDELDYLIKKNIAVNIENVMEEGSVPGECFKSPEEYYGSQALFNFNFNQSNLINKNINSDQKVSENEYFKSKESRKLKEKYFKKEALENATCACGSKALYFTSDLLFICEGCFINNKFPSKYVGRNFHKLTEDLLNCIWTREEEYVLLKNVEKYGDTWSKVNEGLNKTFEQCIFHFIKMPIVEDVTHFPTVPFTQVPNQISTLIAFICSLVYPSISTELAKTALQQINNPNIIGILLNTALEKGRDVLRIEKAKLNKLEKVELEALVKRLMLKIDSINEMHVEIQAVRTELEDEREKLLEEFTKIK